MLSIYTEHEEQWNKDNKNVKRIYELVRKYLTQKIGQFNKFI